MRTQVDEHEHGLADAKAGNRSIGARCRKLPTTSWVGSSPVKIDSLGDKKHSGGGDRQSLTSDWPENSQKVGDSPSKVANIAGGRQGHSQNVVLDKMYLFRQLASLEADHWH